MRRRTMEDYFDAVERAARERGFDSCWLSELVFAAEAAGAIDLADEPIPDDMLQKLGACAAKWFRGEGTAEEGAARYLQMNMVEKRAVQFAFPRSIFVTFNGSEYRCLFPEPHAGLLHVLAAARHERQALVPAGAAGAGACRRPPWRNEATSRLQRSSRFIGNDSRDRLQVAPGRRYGARASSSAIGSIAQLSGLVLALARRLTEAKIDGVVECVPTFRSLMVYYDPLLLPYAALAARIAKLMQGSARDRDARAGPGVCRSATTRASRPISATSRRGPISRPRR